MFVCTGATLHTGVMLLKEVHDVEKYCPLYSIVWKHCSAGKVTEINDRWMRGGWESWFWTTFSQLHTLLALWQIPYEWEGHDLQGSRHGFFCGSLRNFLQGLNRSTTYSGRGSVGTERRTDVRLRIALQSCVIGTYFKVLYSHIWSPAQSPAAFFTCSAQTRGMLFWRM